MSAVEILARARKITGEEWGPADEYGLPPECGWCVGVKGIRPHDPECPAVLIRDLVAALTIYQKDLATCYRLSGADPDGNEDWRLARRAVEEISRMRQDWNEAEAALTERQQQFESIDAWVREEVPAARLSSIHGLPTVKMAIRSLKAEVEEWKAVAAEGDHFEDLYSQVQREVEALRQERDELARRLFYASADITDRKRADALEARLTVVREALKTYGRHTPDCERYGDQWMPDRFSLRLGNGKIRIYGQKGVQGPTYTERDAVCTCGLDAALRVDPSPVTPVTSQPTKEKS